MNRRNFIGTVVGGLFALKVAESRLHTASLTGYGDLREAIKEYHKSGRELDEAWKNAIDVRNFGAMVDGVTDDTEAIQRALDAGGAYIPAGMTCNVSGVLKI